MKINIFRKPIFLKDKLMTDNTNVVSIIDGWFRSTRMDVNSSVYFLVVIPTRFGVVFRRIRVYYEGS